MSSELAEASARTEAFDEQMQESADDIGDTSSATRAAAESTDSFGDAARRSSRRLSTYSTKLNNVSDRLRSTGRAAVEAGQRIALSGGAILAGVGGAAAQAARFESAMVEVQKVTDESTAEQLAGPIEEMSTELPIASTRIAGLAADAARFGVRGPENIQRFTRTVTEMSIATDLSADRAGRALAKISQQAGVPIDNVEGLGSAINALGQNMPTSPEEISQSMLRASSQLRSMGASGEEITALSAVMNTVSESSERAGTRLRSLSQSLTTPDKARKLASALGMTVPKFRQMREESPVALIRRLSESMGSGGEEARRLKNILGRTSRTALTQLSSNLDGIAKSQRISNEQFRTAESLQREVAVATSTLFNQLTTLWNQVKRTARLLGAELLPTIKRGVEFVSAYLKPLNRWIQAHPTLTKRIGLTAAALGGLLVTVGGGLAAFGFFAQGIAAGASALATMTGALSTAASFVGSLATSAGGLSVGLTTLASTAGLVAGAAAVIFKFWRPLAAFFQGFFEGLMVQLDPVISGFQRLFGAVQPIAAKLFDLFTRLISPVGDSVSQFENFASAGRIVGSVLLQSVLTPIRLLTSGITATVGFFSELTVGIKSAAQALMNGNFGQAARAFWDGLKGAFGAILSEMKSFFLDTGVALIRTFVDGLSSREAREALVSGLEGVLSTARSFLPFSPAERGPLSDLDKTGPAMISTIAEGLDGSPLQQRLDSILQGADMRGLTLGVRPEVDAPDLPGAKTPLPGTAASPTIRPEMVEMPSIPSVPDEAMGIIPELRGPVPSPPVEEQTASIRPQMEGPVPSPNIRDQTMSITPEIVGPVPSPAVEEQTAAVGAEMQGTPPRRPAARREGQQGRTVNIEVHNENQVTIKGRDASGDEVQEGIEAGNKDLERRMERVLNEEQRTGF